MEHIALVRNFIDEFERTCNNGSVYKLIGLYELLCHDSSFDELPIMEKFILAKCVEDICNLAGLTTRMDICGYIQKNPHSIEDFIHLYCQLCKITHFSNMNLDERFNVFLAIFDKFISYRRRKCISLNVRCKESSLYKNIIKRYIKKFIKKATKDPSYINENINLWEFFEKIKIEKVEIETYETKKITDKICPCCGKFIVFDVYYYCDGCLLIVNV